MTKFRRVLDHILEGGWLLAVVLITLYFNIYTKDSRIFEPQKALILRTLVTLMLAVWAVRTLDENRERLSLERWWKTAVIIIGIVSAVAAVGLFALELQTWQDPLAGMVGASEVTTATRVFWGLSGAAGTFLILFALGLALVGAGYALRGSWKEALRTAMVIPALAYIAVHVISTIGSVFPVASLYGGYVRQQGTLTVVAYIGLFFLLAFNLRGREQLNRLFTVILLSSIPAALYGVVQKFGIDPLPWMGNVESRVASTMGNAIFIAAYLIMILPLTMYRLVSAWRDARHSPKPEETPGQRSRILGSTYTGLLIAGLGLVLLLVLIYVPISIVAQISLQEQQQTAAALSEAHLWQGFTTGLLFFAGTAVLTVSVPALVYAVITLIAERWRAYAHLAGLALAVLGAAALLLVPGTRTNGYAWGGYLAGLFALGLLSRWQNARRPWGRDALWADATYILVVLQSLFLFIIIQQYLPDRPDPIKWPMYLVALVIFWLVCYVLLGARAGGRVGHLARIGGYLILAGLQLTCIILTQSRGPLVGLLAMIFFFFLALAWRRGARKLLYAALALFFLAGIFLAIFNLPHTPILGNLVMKDPQLASFVETRIQPLRNIPYFGRLGRILDASSGTGRVRILIWFGDEVGSGSVGMIMHHPLRTLIGYGPETMHVAYNPYYPPELAHVEKRNASPDRAHNAIIDELVTLGALGLAAYLFYFAAFFLLTGRLIVRAPDAENQTLAIALLGLGVAHFWETLFGIPIVSTRMYMWIAIGVAVALTLMPPFRLEAPAAAEDKERVSSAEAARRRRRSRGRTPGISTAWALAYTIVIAGALLFVGRVNFKPLWSDILFWTSKQLEAQADAYRAEAAKIADEARQSAIMAVADNYDQQSLESLHRAINLVPYEDFFYLSLAQLYLDRSRGAAGSTQEAYFASTERAILRARDLSPLNTDHYRNLSALYLAWYGQSKDPKYLSRSIAFGEQALSMTGNNADLHNRLAQSYLQTAVGNAAVQQAILPQALVWLDDWEEHHLVSGGRSWDTHLPIVAQYRQEARRLLGEDQLQRGYLVLAAAELQYSLFLDERFSDTYQVLGDLYRQLNMPAEAAVTYAAGIPIKPTYISDSQLSARLSFLSKAGQLDPLALAYADVISATQATLDRKGIVLSQATRDSLVKQILDTSQTLGYIHILRNDNEAAIRAYVRALTIQPSFEAYKNLAILFEKTGRYDQARLQGQSALEMAQANNQAEEVQQLQTFLAMVDLEIRARDNPQDHDAHYQLATVFFQAGRSGAALSEAKLAAQYVPADQPAEVYKVYSLLGSLALAAKEYDVAEPAYKRVLETMPQDFAALYGLAQVYEIRGSTSQALLYAQQALAVAPEAQKAAVQQLIDRLRGGL